MLPPRIYLAGPDVFLADPDDIASRKKALCKKYGFEGVFPTDADAPVQADAAAIFRHNRALMDAPDVTIGLFNLSPFRGPSADPGTAFELGYMHAKGKAVFGYSNSRLQYLDRVARLYGRRTDQLEERDGRLWDPSGYAVEHFGLTDNLMLVRSIAEAGGFIEQVEEQTSDPREFLAAFKAFEACLKRMKEARHASKSTS
jgi:nucleoside 2-deoxyribosyltransferase